MIVSNRIVSILHWPGAKDYIAPLIGEYISAGGYSAYCEPFLGGGRVAQWLMKKGMTNRVRLLLGDLDINVYAVWYSIQHTPEQLWQAIVALLPESYEYHSRSIWLDRKKQLLAKLHSDSLPLFERAAIFLILNRMSFSSITYESGVSLQRVKSLLEGLTLKHILNWHLLLQPVTVVCADYQSTIAQITDMQTFVYLDPPYYGNAGNPLYGEYHSLFDHERLWRYLQELPYHYALSYDDHPDIRDAFQRHHVIEYQFPYRVRVDLANVRKTELIITNCASFARYLLSHNKQLTLPYEDELTTHDY